MIVSDDILRFHTFYKGTDAKNKIWRKQKKDAPVTNQSHLDALIKDC